VKIAESGPADQTAMISSIVTPGAIAPNVEDLASDADIVYDPAAVAAVASFVDRLGFDPRQRAGSRPAMRSSPKSVILGAPLSPEKMRRRLAVVARAAWD
jgi:hypothetical protein